MNRPHPTSSAPRRRSAMRLVKWQEPGVTTEHPTVSERIQALLRGERSAKTWLYDTFSPRLYRRLLGRYGHWKRLDIDDLLHDVFLLFFKNNAETLRRFHEGVPEGEQTERRLDRYLWDTACGVMANRRRSYQRAPAFEELDTDTLHLEDLSFEAQAMRRDQLNRLAGALRKRDLQLYLYYKMRYVDGLTPREISQVTGWPLKAIYRLRTTLADTVQRCAEELEIET